MGQGVHQLERSVDLLDPVVEDKYVEIIGRQEDYETDYLFFERRVLIESVRNQFLVQEYFRIEEKLKEAKLLS